MIVKEFDYVKQAVSAGVISNELLEEKVKRILSYKYILNVHKFEPINTSTLKRKINSSESQWVQNKIYDNIVTLAKNDSSIIPIKELDKNKIASVAIGTSSQTMFQTWMKRYADVHTFQAPSLAEIPKVRDRKSVV